MELSELIAYAKEKYQIEEQHKWADFPGFSVLCHPHTGKWVALLMRQWDTESGTEIQRCDLKCGKQSLLGLEKSYLSAPVRMKGQKWISVAFGAETEPEVIFKLLDRAISSGDQRGYTIVLGTQPSFSETSYQDTALPFDRSSYQPPKEVLPERLRQMRRLVACGRESMEDRAKNFYQQGRFMEDYEDDAPWTGDFVCYFPTYHDLTTKQLRGYFSWRTGVRRGEFHPIAASAAYLYVYELLNGIGAASPEDSLQKLKAFEEGFLDSGFGDARMRPNLRRWMLEFAVMQDLPPETAREYADRELLQKDAALAILRSPGDYSDEEVFSALCQFGGKKLTQSPVVTNDPDRGRHLFSEAWRAASRYRWQEKDLFTLCFGEKAIRRWYPLANAVYYQQSRPTDVDYALDECRSYHCRSGVWQAEAYEKLGFDKDRFQGFLHEADLRLRRHLKTGRYLRERPEDAWAATYIDAVIEADHRAALEAARPKITLDLSGLEQIRRDAQTTRDSLLTEEELEEMEEQVVPESADDSLTEEEFPDIPLDAVQIQILHILLQAASPAELIRANHLTPSLVADMINEALFDEIGDTVLSCEDDELALIEDYKEDIAQMLGGIET